MPIPDLQTYLSRFIEAQELVRSLVRRGGLLAFQGVPRPNWKRVELLERAYELATSQEEDVAPIVWLDVRAHELARTGATEYEHRREIERLHGDWLDEALDWAFAFTPEPYAEIAECIGTDLHDFVLLRAAVGRDSWLFEQMWAAIESGGWPCGIDPEAPPESVDGDMRIVDPSRLHICVLWDPDHRTPAPAESASLRSQRHVARRRRQSLLSRFPR